MNYQDLPNPPRSNKQVLEYTTAAKKGLRSQYVVRTSAGWYVRAASSGHASKHYASKDEAMVAAHTQAASDRGEVFVFDQYGELTT